MFSQTAKRVVQYHPFAIYGVVWCRLSHMSYYYQRLSAINVFSIKKTNPTLKRNRNVSIISNFSRIPLTSISFSWNSVNNFIAYCNFVVSQVRLQHHRIRYCFKTTKTLLETNIMFFVVVVAGNTILNTWWFNGKSDTVANHRLLIATYYVFDTSIGMCTHV